MQSDASSPPRVYLLDLIFFFLARNLFILHIKKEPTIGSLLKKKTKLTEGKFSRCCFFTDFIQRVLSSVFEKLQSLQEHETFSTTRYWLSIFKFFFFYNVSTLKRRFFCFYRILRHFQNQGCTRRWRGVRSCTRARAHTHTHARMCMHANNVIIAYN